MMVTTMLLFALNLFLAAAHVHAAVPLPLVHARPHLVARQSFDMGSITSHIPSLCVAPCLPMESYWETNAKVCGGVTNVQSGLDCLNTVCAKTFFDMVSACTACILQAVPSDVVEIITEGIDGVGEVCRIMGFQVGVIAGAVTGNGNNTNTNGNAATTSTGAAAASGSALATASGTGTDTGTASHTATSSAVPAGTGTNGNAAAGLHAPSLVPLFLLVTLLGIGAGAVL